MTPSLHMFMLKKNDFALGSQHIIILSLEQTLNQLDVLSDKL